jgi:hypothetical protein
MRQAREVNYDASSTPCASSAASLPQGTHPTGVRYLTPYVAHRAKKTVQIWIKITS